MWRTVAGDCFVGRDVVARIDAQQRGGLGWGRGTDGLLVQGDGIGQQVVIRGGTVARGMMWRGLFGVRGRGHRLVQEAKEPVSKARAF